MSNFIAVFLGKISYSLYLWHWPIIVFFRYYTNQPLSNLDMFIAAVLSLLAAYISYRFIETPLRRPWTEKSDRLAVPAGILAAIVPLLVFPATVWAGDGWKWRLSPTAQAEIAQMTVNERLKCESADVVGLRRACIFGATDQSPRIVVIGDSHAGRLALGLQGLLESNGDSAILARFPGVAPFIEVDTYEGTERRRSPVERGFNALVEVKPELVFIHARFGNYWWTSEGPQSGNPSRSIGINGAPGSIAESQANFIFGLQKTLDLLETMPGEKVIIGALPFPGVDLKQCAQRPTYLLGATSSLLDKCGGLTRDQALNRAQAVNQILRREIEQRGFIFVDPTEVLCPPEQRFCLRVLEGKFVFDDNNHLNANGGRLLARQVLLALDAG